MQFGLALVALGLFAVAVPGHAQGPGKHPRVAFETTQGRFVVELDAARAPRTVENFLGYVESGFFDGTIFHRVIPGFMVQGGGFTADMNRKPTRAPVENEAANGLSNQRGTVAMARTSDPDSATAQFFINTVDNSRNLDPAPGNAGYTVFGKVIEGMEVVDSISSVRTGRKKMMPDVPVEPVVIEKASVVDG